MELEYFRLRQSARVANPVRIEKLDAEKYVYKMDEVAFEKIEDLTVAYYRNATGLEICELLQTPCFMIADRFMELFELLEPAIVFKGIQLYPLDFQKYMCDNRIDAPTPLFRIPYLAPTDCLHADAVVYDTGMVGDLVIRADAAGGSRILKVAGTVEEIWLASLTAAECILRRRPLGIEFEPVKVRN